MVHYVEYLVLCDNCVYCMCIEMNKNYLQSGQNGLNDQPISNKVFFSWPVYSVDFHIYIQKIRVQLYKTHLTFISSTPLYSGYFLTFPVIYCNLASCLILYKINHSFM